MRCENISTGRLDYYVENSGAVFIDLRSRQEYEKMHIKDAVNIPFEEMERRISGEDSCRRDSSVSRKISCLSYRFL